jgi:hypothetical protein
MHLKVLKNSGIGWIKKEKAIIQEFNVIKVIQTL